MDITIDFTGETLTVHAHTLAAAAWVDSNFPPRMYAERREAGVTVNSDSLAGLIESASGDGLSLAITVRPFAA